MDHTSFISASCLLLSSLDNMMFDDITPSSGQGQSKNLQCERVIQRQLWIITKTVVCVLNKSDNTSHSSQRRLLEWISLRCHHRYDMGRSVWRGGGLAFGAVKEESAEKGFYWRTCVVLLKSKSSLKSVCLSYCFRKQHFSHQLLDCVQHLC